MIKLFHGTNESSAKSIVYTGIDLKKSQKYLDFGRGFYTTPDEFRARKWAKRKTEKYNRRNNKIELPSVVILYVDESKIFDLNYKYFKWRRDDWMKFIISNRIGESLSEKERLFDNNLKNQYDLVYGSIADGIISDKAYRMRMGEIKLSEIAVNDLLPENGAAYGMQISFHTQDALKIVEKMEYIRCEEGKEWS